jgi:Holliday junction resolvase RusA-like endonuclease
VLPDAHHLFSVDLVFVLSDRRPRDIDNLAKTVLDALNKRAWKDDAQVVRLSAKLTRGSLEPPFTLVRIRTEGIQGEA